MTTAEQVAFAHAHPWLAPTTLVLCLLALWLINDRSWRKVWKHIWPFGN